MIFNGGTLLCLILVYAAYRLARWLDGRAVRTTNQQVGRDSA